MKIYGIILITLSILGGLMASMMFGDIGIAALIASLASLFSGLGLLKANKEMKALKKN